MINIIIIDDEPLVTLGLSKLLQNEEYKITTFDNTLSAFDYINQDVPIDIVISDIQMPNMDGIGLCFEIRKRHDAEIIIISGYQNFEYAKRVVELSAVKYVLKPINQQEFLTVVREAAARIQKRRAQEEKDLKKSAYVLSKYLSDIANGVNTFDFCEIEKTIFFFENTDCFCVAILMLPTLFSLSSEYMRSFTSEVREVLEKQLRERVDPRRLTLCEYHPGRFLMMLGIEYSRCLPLLNTVREQIQDLFEFDIICSLSLEHSGFTQIHTAVQESVSALQYILNNNTAELAVTYDISMDVPSDEYSVALNSMRFQHYARQFIDYALSIMDKEQMEAAADQLFGEFHVSKANVLTIQKQCESLLLCIRYECGKLFTNEISAFEKLEAEITYSFQNTLSIQNIREVMSELLERLAHIVNALHHKKIDNIIATVNHLLNSDCKTITLQSAADYIGIHSSYFSAVFKEKSGVNFKDYVINYKMEAAKKLLGNRNSKIYQIADQLGYFDTDYFSRVFKKKYGLTPKEYREFSLNTPNG